MSKRSSSRRRALRSTRPTSAPAKRQGNPLSPLTQRMLQDMQLAGLSAKTRESYLRAVGKFAQWLNKAPDIATEDELRRYLLHIKNDQQWEGNSLKVAYSGIEFSYTRTCPRDWATLKKLRIPKQTKLPTILTASYQQRGCQMSPLRPARPDGRNDWPATNNAAVKFLLSVRLAPARPDGRNDWPATNNEAVKFHLSVRLARTKRTTGQLPTTRLSNFSSPSGSPGRKERLASYQQRGCQMSPLRPARPDGRNDWPATNNAAVKCPLSVRIARTEGTTGQLPTFRGFDRPLADSPRWSNTAATTQRVVQHDSAGPDGPKNPLHRDVRRPNGDVQNP